MEYICTFLLSTILLFIAQHSKKTVGAIFNIGGVLCLVLLAGFRKETIGTDVLYYGKPIFEAANNINSVMDFVKLASLYSIEYGYLFFNVVIQKLGFSLQMLLILISIVTILFTYKAINLIPYKNKWELMLIFDLIFFNQSLNNLRQFMSMSIILYVLTKVLFDKPKYTIFYIIVAVLIHRSAVISIGFFFIYYVYKKNWISKLRFLIYIAVIFVQVLFYYILSFISGIGFWGQKYAGHLFESLTSGLDFVGYKCILEVFPLIILVTLIIKTKKIKLVENDIVFELLFVFSLITVCFNVIYRGEFIERILWYVDYVTFLIGIPYFLNIIQEKMKSLYLVKVYMFISFGGYWFINYIIQNNCETYPYSFFWM